MDIEAQLTWNDGQLSGRDRLIVPATALAADGRWQAALPFIERQGTAQVDPAPWIVPSGLEPVQMPFGDFRVRTLPIAGRFYPRLAFPPIAQGPRDFKPVRLVAREGGQLRVDPNHPLAGLTVRFELSPTTLPSTPGTHLIDLFDGPGMQRTVADPGSSFLRLDALKREDESSDTLFYQKPRFTQHLDATCCGQLSQFYARLLQPGQRVLDLMASWTSHLPEALSPAHLAGLGLNGLELHANRDLSERVVKDLNERPELPWSEAQFDAAICTASIEYLTQPLAIIREVRRVLRPGGLFAVTFSDRWFPTKAIRVWSELHAFERMGLVVSLLAQAGFTDLRSETLRGLKRPDDDKYIDQRGCSDPLFAVWGRTPRA